MPSENKTVNIGLNQWQANEYPKREDFNADNLAIDEALGEKLSKSGEGKDVTVTFDEATTRTNIGTGQKLSVLLGKIKKWFSDLTDLAFGKCGSAANQALYTTGGGVVTADKLPVEAGGTGASTAQVARKNLDITDANVPISDDVATTLGLDPTTNPQVKDGFEQFTKYWWKRTLVKHDAIIGNTYTDFNIAFSSGHSDRTTKVYYSEQINILGKKIELNNPSVVNISYDDYKTANLLKNKYIRVNNGATIVYGKPDGEATRDEESSGGYISITYYRVFFPVTSVNSGDTSFEYINSSDSNAYPDDEILDRYYYLKLNNFFENALNTLNFEKGCYIGTGTFGIENKNRLVLGFKPTIVIIMGEDVSPLIMINPSPDSELAQRKSSGDYNAEFGIVNTEWGKKSVSWYSSGSAGQLNIASEIYYYISLGFKE